MVRFLVARLVLWGGAGRVAVAGKAARKIAGEPGPLIRADRVSLTGCDFGVVNEAAARPYRLFISGAGFELKNFSDRFYQGPAQARLTGKFMGSGTTAATADFRPQRGGSDFDLHLKVQDTRMTALNDLLRTYGDFDLSAGEFSLVSELQVRNGMLSGDLTPFFRGMQVYDKRKDRGKAVAHKAYELLVGAAAVLLQNRSRQEVATRVEVEGALHDPRASCWQMVGALLGNAFFKAVIPGFEREAPGTARRRAVPGGGRAGGGPPNPHPGWSVP